MNRRHFLQGTGTILALPFLESFAGKKVAKPPVRLAYIGFIFGITRDNHWYPKKTARDFELTDGLKPLAKHKKDLTLFENLRPVHTDHDPHQTATHLLTCKDAKQRKGGAYDLISCDQLAATTIGQSTRYASLQLSGKNEGGCGPGFSLSWDKYGKPIPGYTNPLVLFNELFGTSKVSLKERRYLISEERSILDALGEQSKSLHRKISKADKDKIDEYFTSIRHIERSLSKTEQWLDVAKPKPGMAKPATDLSATDHIKTMYDIMVAALQTDLTRVISYRQPLGMLLKELELGGGHDLSHASQANDKMENATKKDQAHSKLLSYMIDRLKSTKEVDGSTLFDNIVLSFASGSNIGHSNNTLPAIVTGRGGGKIKPCGYIKLEQGKDQMSNLWLTTLHAAGASVDKFSHSTGIIKEMWV